MRKWLASNREEARARNRKSARKCYAQDPEKVLKRTRKWASANPEKEYARCARRRACKLNATPSWLTKDHKSEILSLYKEAQETGMHVDHIIPLRGNCVCGLHVPWNLQLLAPKENMSKGNSF